MQRKSSVSRKEILWSIALVVVFAAGALAALWSQGAFTRAPAKLRESTAFYPVQYSDTHITKNAIAADPRYKDVVAHRTNLLAAAFLGFPQSKNVAPTPATSTPEKGTWLWTPTLDITPAYRDAVIAGAERNGIKNIYLSLDSYLDIFVLPDGPGKAARQKAFDAVVEGFIAAARARGIAVDAEGGWRNWAERGNVYKPFALLEYVKGFNASHAEKFRGFQYDVEPYLLDAYRSDKEMALSNLLDLVDETVARLDNTGLRLSVVIPDFYDGTAGETPRFFYNLRFGYELDHLFTILERRPGSQLVVMAYRNRSDGADGSIEISRDEVQKSDRFATKVVIAQETGDASPPSVTFYRTSRARLSAAVKSINQAFAGHAEYNGTAIHYLNALMALK